MVKGNKCLRKVRRWRYDGRGQQVSQKSPAPLLELPIIAAFKGGKVYAINVQF